jgi:hypothetical protein
MSDAVERARAWLEKSPIAGENFVRDLLAEVDAWREVAIDCGAEDGRLSRETVSFVLEGRVRRRLEAKP